MRSSPEGLARVKRLTAEMSRDDLDGSRELAVKALTEIAADQSVLEALRNFADGMTPPWFSTYKPSQKLFLEDTH